MKVIPTINSKNFEEIKEKIKILEQIEGVDWLQIDVADSTFTENNLWHNAPDLLTIKTNLKIEVHLMINDIEKGVENWIIEPVKRIIFHLEATKDPHIVIQKIKETDKEIGIAITPDTPWTQLMPFCDKADIFQILSVYPGLPGQEFIEDSLQKIKSLRDNCLSAIIEVDGGINKKTAKKCAEAGADIVATASYLFNSDNIKKTLEELSEI
ncbi:MAG: ribulose-phosphate 3-epimerase [Candidatus Marinimicrobia bacterium]|nr:ribulose-phosphate 3-epimerase [Candidatus Neomarinimicrobiota bacterium]